MHSQPFYSSGVSHDTIVPATNPTVEAWIDDVAAANPDMGLTVPDGDSDAPGPRPPPSSSLGGLLCCVQPTPHDSVASRDDAPGSAGTVSAFPVARALAYAALVSVGMMGAFSYHCFLADPHYIETYYRFASGNEHEAPGLDGAWAHITTYLSNARLATNLGGQLLVVSPVGRRLPMYHRIVAAVVCMAAGMAVVPLLPFLRPSQSVAFAAVIGAVAVTGIGAAFAQATAFALASYFPHSYSEGVLIGMATSATLCSVFKLLTKKVWSGGSFDSDRTAANVFFGITISWALVALLLTVLLRCNPAARACVPELIKLRAQEACTTSSDDAEPTPPYETPLLSPNPTASLSNPTNPTFVAQMQHTSTNFHGSTQPALGMVNAPHEDPNPLSRMAEDEDGSVETEAERWLPMMRRIVRVLWPLLLANGLVFASSFLIFPGVMTHIDSDPWFKIYVVLVFQASITAGRLFARPLKTIACLASPSVLGLSAAVRALLVIPLVLSCGHARVLHSTAAAYSVTAALGLLGGILSALIMAAATTHPDLSPQQRAQAGSVVSLSILVFANVGEGLAVPLTHALL